MVRSYQRELSFGLLAARCPTIFARMWPCEEIVHEARHVLRPKVPSPHQLKRPFTGFRRGCALQ
jgi:hypothetical protein